jgi:hypothetical protein
MEEHRPIFNDTSQMGRLEGFYRTRVVLTSSSSATLMAKFSRIETQSPNHTPAQLTAKEKFMGRIPPKSDRRLLSHQINQRLEE